MEYTKSYKRNQRRELFEKFYKNRIKHQMNAYGHQQMLNPFSESFHWYCLDPLKTMQQRTKDWKKIRFESTWMYKYKDVHKKYKDDDWLKWNEKLRQHLDRVRKNEEIKKGIEEYYEDIKLSK